jgi:hypothetical protein
MKRPVGVTILAVIAVIYGIFSLLLALLGLLGSALLASHVAAAAIKYSAGTLAYATISDAVLGILYLAFGIGAFRLKGWAWTTGVAALVLEIVRQIAGIVIQGFKASTIVIDGIIIVIALLLLWYLFRPSIRGAFGNAA